MFPCELSASSLFIVIHCGLQLLEQAQLDQSSYFWKQCFKLPWATVSLFSRDEAIQILKYVRWDWMMLVLQEDLCLFPVTIQWNQVDGGALHSSSQLQTRDLYLFLGTAPASHTCMIPLECLATSFSQRSMYTRVLGHLYLSCRRSQIKCAVPRDKVCPVEEGKIVRKLTEIR